MGADKGVRTVLKGLSRSLDKNNQLSFLIFGREDEIRAAIKRFKKLASRSKIVHCEDVVAMDDKPAQIMRRGKSTSMYGAISAVKSGDAQVAVSCGNTGALMALSMLILRKAPKINRPAIAVLWPSRSKAGVNIMLDGGADIKADAEDYLHYTIMGASYARNAFDLPKPRVGLLNVGTEEHKGRAELQEANEKIHAAADKIEIEYKGFVEGGDLVGNTVDVIVTDGFTGNVALKTGEGTAKLISDNMKAAFKHSFLSKIGAMFSYSSLNRLRKNMDPRRFNGGVFLGLNGTVIKSHGSSDAVAMSSAVKLAFRLAQNDFHNRVSKRLNATLGGEGLNDE